MTSEHKILDLWDDIREDPKFAHLRAPGIRLVPGYGASRPLAFVVGEAPGATENQRGEPFCGASGRVLHQLMDIAGLRSKHYGPVGSGLTPNVWLTNAIKFRPPGNRTPTLREILDNQDYLRREWAIVGRPRLIVAVGSVAADVFNVHPIRMQRGELFPLKDGRTYICYQYHPAYGLRNKAVQPTMERHWDQLGDAIKEMGW